MSAADVSAQRAYTTDFFQNLADTSLHSARVVVPLILELVPAKSVVDVGCGTGAWLKVFAEQGVEEYRGMDGSYVDMSKLQIPRERFAAHDLNTPLALDRRYDLAVCLEVGEHLPAESADMLVESLAKTSDCVVFSAAVPMQGGTSHVNEQWPAYWAEKFARRGYVAIDCLRRRIWEEREVSFWFAQNMVVYATEAALARFPAVAALRREEDARPMALVHPGNLELKCRFLRQAATPPLRTLIRLFPGAIMHAVKNRFGRGSKRS